MQSAYDNTGGTFLSSVENLLSSHPDAGWLLRYDDLATPVYYVWNPNVTTGGVECATQGCFIEISTGGKTIYNTTQTIPYYQVLKQTGISWQVTMYKDFAGKTMYTPVLVQSDNGSDFNSNYSIP